MWEGKEDVDKYSVGIECVGYHNKAMPVVQLRAISALVKELQSMYDVPDHRVVCHSHIAYGAANKWHKFKHRGRKRCGMLFAMPSVRRQLGLSTRPGYDPDTKAGRLKQADAYLQKVLYGRLDTMTAVYGETKPVSPAPVLTPRIVTKPAAPAKPKAAVAPAKPATKKATSKPKPAATRIHVVKRGETLNVISQTTGVPVQKIRELNGLKGDKILVGQKLKLAK